MKKRVNKAKRLELAKTFMVAIIAKHPPVLNEEREIYTQVARGALSYADALLLVSEEK